LKPLEERAPERSEYEIGKTHRGSVNVREKSLNNADNRTQKLPYNRLVAVASKLYCLQLRLILMDANSHYT